MTSNNEKFISFNTVLIGVLTHLEAESLILSANDAESEGLVLPPVDHQVVDLLHHLGLFSLTIVVELDPGECEASRSQLRDLNSWEKAFFFFLCAMLSERLLFQHQG